MSQEKLLASLLRRLVIEGAYRHEVCSNDGREWALESYEHLVGIKVQKAPASPEPELYSLADSPPTPFRPMTLRDIILSDGSSAAIREEALVAYEVASGIVTTVTLTAPSEPTRVLSAEQWAHLRATMYSRDGVFDLSKKISAIKVLREMIGCGLKTAKDYVDNMPTRLPSNLMMPQPKKEDDGPESVFQMV